MDQNDQPDGPPARRRPSLPVRLGLYAKRDIFRTYEAGRDATRDRSRGAPRIDGFDQGRDLHEHWRWSACYAPATSMYFDQFGKVRACCQNTGHLLGDVNRSTLGEIWRGQPVKTLRRALEQGDFGDGCDFCAWEIAEVGPVGSFSSSYDGHPVGPRPNPTWPEQLEFSVTNTCNLQCVMCNGDWSSAIRAQREHRPPLPSAYPERFYDELVAFIPHLHDAKFTGGEPFLGREPLRILGLLAEHRSPRLRVTITTNGTVCTPRVERLVTELQPRVVVSLDGGTAEAYERIRIGARFDEVIANVDHFRQISTHVDGGVSITHCLMVDNWQSFPELLYLAEERDLVVGINTVRFPERHSLFHLLPHELADVVTGLETRNHEVERLLTGQRLDTWRRELAWLRARSESETWPEALGQRPERQELARVTEVPIALGPRRTAP
jgi:MoaA/NifB/PqqE/SkfB family radical SAM enzyme